MDGGVAVTPRGGISLSHPADLSIIVNQNRMKLRVNRVAILQELRAEHVVGYLAHHDVLTPHEMRTICTEKSQPVAVLLDILAQKDNSSQWYAHFIKALQQAEVDLSQKRRYRRLVDFLENTIIRVPPRDQREKLKVPFPRFKPLPDITEQKSVKSEASHDKATKQETAIAESTPGNTPRQEKDNSHQTGGTQQSVVPYHVDHSHYKDGGSPNPRPRAELVVAIIDPEQIEKPEMTLVSGHYHQWVPLPKTHFSRLPDPADVLISLETADDRAFHEQIRAEKLALHRMKELETLYLMHRQKRLPAGFVLCMGDCVRQIVDDRENHHLYVKYFIRLKHDYNLYIVKELVGSFTNWLMSTKLGDVEKNADLLQKATRFATNLFDLLDELGEYVCAEEVISVLTMFLMVQPCLETWMHAYNACIRLARIRIRNFEFKQADKALNSAIQYLNAIKLMSFGKDLVDESEKMVATSWLMYEMGNHEAAYHWAHDGLKEVWTENKAGIVIALCNGAKCFAAKYSLKRAHELATEAVRQAGEHFGRAHPMFIKARLTYLEFVNEFCTPSDKILRMAVDTLKRCELIYHCDSMLLARTHLVVSNAYITANKINDENYLNHAHRAQRIAMNCVNGMHPILAVFAEQIARCALLKARTVPKPVPPPDTLAKMQQTQLLYAASELGMAYRVYSVCFGTKSYRAATAQITLADILTEENSLEEAAVMYEDALNTFGVCMSGSSPYFAYLKARYAKFLYKKGELDKALELLESVVEHLTNEGLLESSQSRVHWMEDIFQIYIKAVSDLNDEDRLQRAKVQRQTWLDRTAYIQPLPMAELDKKPQNFKDFKQSFMLWKKVQVKRVAKLGQEAKQEGSDAVVYDDKAEPQEAPSLD